MSLRRKTFLILELLLLFIIGMLVLLTYRFFHEQSQYRLFLIILFIMSVLIAAIVYFIVDYLTISRIEKLTRALEHITSSHNLSERLQIDHSRDDVSLILIKLDSEDRVVFVSPSFCELFSVKANYVLYQPLLKSTHSKAWETIRQAIQALPQPPYEGYAELYLKTDKGWRWLGWLGKALRDECGEVTGIILTTRHITGQKENEIALADIPGSYRSTLDSLDDMVQMADEDLRILLCNEVFQNRKRQLGQDGNLIGRKLFEVQDFLYDGCGYVHCFRV